MKEKIEYAVETNFEKALVDMEKTPEQISMKDFVELCFNADPNHPEAKSNNNHVVATLGNLIAGESLFSYNDVLSSYPKVFFLKKDIKKIASILDFLCEVDYTGSYSYVEDSYVEDSYGKSYKLFLKNGFIDLYNLECYDNEKREIIITQYMERP